MLASVVVSLLLAQTGSFNGVMPANGTAVGARDPNGRMQPFRLDGSGALLTGSTISNWPAFPWDVVVTNTVDVNVTNTVAVTGPLTDAQLRAAPVEVTGTFAANTTGFATNAAPSYPDGTNQPLSLDANGNLRVSGTINASSSAKATAAAPTYLEGADEPFSQTLAGALRTFVTNWPATVAVTGTFWQATQPISAVSLPLPTGAATEATLQQVRDRLVLDPILTNLRVSLWDQGGRDLDFRQENENWNAADHGILIFGRDTESTPQKYRALGTDAEGHVGVHLYNGSDVEIGTLANPIRVDPTGTTPQPVTGTFWPATQPVSGTVTVTDGAGALNVIVDSSALPSGAATEATLSAINTKTPALGQATMAASSPVVIASNQSAVPVGDNGGSLTVDFPTTQGITIWGSAMGATGPAPVTSHAVNVDQRALDVWVNNWPATQPVSAASLPLPAGASTSALQTTGNSSLSSIDGKLPAYFTTASDTLDSLNDAFAAALSGASSAIVRMSGTISATLVPEYSMDGGSTYMTAAWFEPATPSVQTTEIVNVGGLVTTRGLVIPNGSTHVRVRVSAFTSGSTSIRITVAQTPPMVTAVTDGGGSLTVDGSVTAVPSGDFTVVGKAADGAVPSGNPVLIAGMDGANVQTVLTDNQGRVYVNANLGTIGGAATEATLAAASAKLPASLGAKTGAGSLSVVPATDATFVTTPSADNVASGTIDALFEAVTVAVAGKRGVGFVITSVSSPVGFELQPQVSYDGGSTWVGTIVYNPATRLTAPTLVNADVVQFAMRTIVLPGGVSHARIVSTSLTSGSATIQLRASEIADNSWPFVSSPGEVIPPSVVVIGGSNVGATTMLSLDASGRPTVNVNGAVPVTDNGSSLTVDFPTTQGITIWGSAMGATGAAPVTSRAVNADTRALDVWVENTTPIAVNGTVTVTDGAGALNTIVDSGTITAVTSITNPVTVAQATAANLNATARVQDGAGNALVSSVGLPSTSDRGLVVRAVTISQPNATNTGTCTNVSTSTTVLAGNTSRRVGVVLNNGTAAVHLKLGATATTSNPPLQPGQSFTIDGSTVYTGVVDVIASTGTQSVCAYEW